MGDHQIDCLYSDNSGEIGKACRVNSIATRNSLPGLPKNNAIIERTNQDILQGIRTVLVRAGLPACFWTYACYHYCLMENVMKDSSGTSAWFRTHEEDFNGELLPFGCAVIYKPSDTVGITPGKMEGTGRRHICGLPDRVWIQMVWTATSLGYR